MAKKVKPVKPKKLDLFDKCEKCGEMTAITHPKIRNTWCPRCGAWY